MTKNQKLQLRLMRINGEGYMEIANALGVTTNVVRSFCHRNKLTDEDLENSSVCLYCGEAILPHRGVRRLYCSEKCRSAWRRATKHYSDTVYHHVCAACGREFQTEGNKRQVYCSQACYHRHRKGGAA